MKQRIFKSSKGGWYVLGSNYQDKNDVAYLNLFFPEHSEPQSNEKYIDIDILEGKFTSYKGKIGWTIFKYLESKKEEKKEDTSKFGNSDVQVGNDTITSDDLPFDEPFWKD